MSYILDTCSISEFVAVKPELNVIQRLTSLPREEIYLCSITIGELEQGVIQAKATARKAFLRKWLDEHVLIVYAERILPIDTTVARNWGILCAELRRRGFTMQIKDSFIAATALVHNLTVVTRNESDFAHCGCRIFNPWK